MTSPYSPLTHESDILLLRIPPRSHVSGDNQSFRLIHVSLARREHLPSYETISYCWGDPADSAQVNIDGFMLDVPQSTAEVLERVTLEDRERCVWIDAVCINQANLEERSHEVTLMGLIYSSAVRNLIYLGKAEDSEVTNSLAALEMITSDIHASINKQGYSDFSSFISAIWRGDATAVTALDHHFNGESLLVFFNRPWFSRVWVVQEAVLSAENICLYGNREINLELALEAGRWLSKFRFFNLDERFQMNRGLMNATVLYEQREQMALDGGVAFALTFGMTSSLQMTDLRDKVFGTLGMCFENETENRISELLAVDYNKPY
ncbi:heterokaryon incompatibility protein-domain-containing protein [Xylariaceae sp. FL0255]|nr:heterokaryon incompatibility protein-domain-containing protein [Xylariaceae sp. FL0255]